MIWDALLRERVMAGKTGDWRRFGRFVLGTLGSVALTVALRALVRGISSGGGDGDEREHQREALRIATDVTGELGGAALPGADRPLEGLLRLGWAAASGDRSILPRGASDDTLLAPALTAANGVGNGIVRWIETGEITQAQGEKLLLDAHRAIGMAVGLPTGGVEQGVRVAARGGSSVGQAGRSERRGRQEYPAAGAASITPVNHDSTLDRPV